MSTATATPDIAGVHITHAEREVYPDTGITKGDLAEHAERMASLMLPHIAGRPLSFVRCPDGIGGECFYQKHVPDDIGDAVERVRITHKDGSSKQYAVVHDALGLVELVQFGIVEIHCWGCQHHDLESPDRVVFDLDPDEGVHWDTTVDAAAACREKLAKVGLKSWPMTTGGKGIHVAAPIERRSTWDQVHDFARSISEELEREYPYDFVSGASKKERTGKIFVDWLRNSRGNTWIAPWSPRARDSATVAVPLTWQGLRKLKRAGTATIDSVRRERKPRRDPWATMLKTRQQLP